MPKVVCPYHRDTNPSMEVYADSLYCFVCGAQVSREKYERDTNTRSLPAAREKVKEDLAGSIAAIKAMPKARIRGLDLHTDGESYFILWPGDTYYTRRFFDTDMERGKYRRPAGWPTPLFVAADGMKGMSLLIVEGEINALSIAAAIPDIGVCSPGSAGDFSKAAGLNNLPFYLSYRRQVLVADEDAAGALACIELAKHLKGKSGDVQILLMKKVKHGGKGDANEILEAQGKTALREEVLSKIKFSMV